MEKKKILDVNKWLKTNPRKNEVVEILTTDGKKVKVIQQKVIESLLDDMTDQNWDTVNFKSSRYLTKDGRELMDASLELIVRYKGTDGYNVVRVLTGSYTINTAFLVGGFENNTIKSLCITNAASELGKRFGKDLNPSVISFVSNVPPSQQEKILNTLKHIETDMNLKNTGND